MEKLIEVKNSIVSQIIDLNPNASHQGEFIVYPQMPIKQIEHYIKQAALKDKYITIQLNPSKFSKEVSEVSGNIKISTRTSHIVLTTENEQTIHLIQPRSIRHLRLVD